MVDDAGWAGRVEAFVNASDGQFQWSVHGCCGGSVEHGWGLVVEAASALSVDDRGGVVGGGLFDVVEA